MKIVYGYPPNIEEITAALPASRRRGVIFTYGDTIYNPDRITLSKALIAHEEVHESQQLGATVKYWWRRYINNPEFRFAQELEAHRAEYQKFCEGHKDRNARSSMLSFIARRLAGPLYGGIITVAEAKGRIL